MTIFLCAYKIDTTFTWTFTAHITHGTACITHALVQDVYSAFHAPTNIRFDATNQLSIDPALWLNKLP